MSEKGDWENIIVIGHLGKDPIIKYTKNEKAIASCSVAVYAGKDNPPMWFLVDAWEETAIDFQATCKKGDNVRICGHIGYNSWEKDGEKKSNYKIVANSFELLKATPKLDDDLPF